VSESSPNPQRGTDANLYRIATKRPSLREEGEVDVEHKLVRFKSLQGGRIPAGT